MNGVRNFLSAFPVTIKSNKIAQRMWVACRAVYRVAWNSSTYLGSLHYLTLVWIWASALMNEHRWITFNEVLTRYDHLILKLVAAVGRGA